MVDLERIVELSATMIRRHIQKARIEKGKDGKYNVENVMAAILKHRRQDNKNGSSREISESTGKLKATKAIKIALECKILQIKLEQLRGELIPMTEHTEELVTYAAIVNAVFDQDLDEVAMLIKDAKLYKRFQDRRDIVRQRLVDAIEKL